MMNEMEEIISGYELLIVGFGCANLNIHGSIGLHGGVHDIHFPNNGIDQDFARLVKVTEPAINAYIGAIAAGKNGGGTALQVVVM